MFLYVLIREMFRVFYTLWFRVDSSHRERVPARGPVVVCGNHFSWWDPVTIAIMVRRPVYFMAKAELFAIPVFGPILKRIGAYPVRRGLPDRTALRRTYDLLEKGHAIGMFPEGTRTRTGYIGKAEPGAALVAVKTGSPVVPVAIIGQYRFRGRIQVNFGEPVYLSVEGGKARNEELARLSESIMDRIIDLSEGRWSRPAPAAAAATAATATTAAEDEGPHD